MKMAPFTLPVALAAALLVLAPAESTSPIGKTIQLLSDLQAKIIREGEGAQKIYSEFAEWCEDSAKSLTHEIKSGKAESADLKAAIAEHDATSGSLDARVEKLAGDISAAEGDLKAATRIRSKDAAAFKSEQKELIELTDTLRRAVSVLEREMRKGGASLLQMHGADTVAQALGVLVEASMLSTSDASRLTALVQMRDSDDGLGAPAGAVYESHSGGIVQTVSDLLEKAEDQLDAARKKETQEQHNFQMTEQSLKDEIKLGNKELKEAKAGIAAAKEKKAKAQKDLARTSKGLASDVAGLGDLHHECMSKAQNFEAETKSRAEELKALAAAKKAVEDNTGGATEQTYGLNQVSLLQTSRLGSSRASLAQFEAARLVRDLARKHGSTELAQLAAKMSSSVRTSSRLGQDPFAKVKALVREMIERLEKEAGEDATKKAFCDKELGETNTKKTDKSSQISKLSTQLDKMSARKGQLKEQIADLQKELASLVASQAKMDQIRAEEKDQYGKNKPEMEQGLRGVQLALKILNDYYGNADKAHASAEGGGSSIIGLLEVVESDFTKGLAEMTAEEESAQSDFEAETKDNALQKTTKEQDVKYKTKEAAQLDNTAAEATTDRSAVQAELDAVMEYLRKIEEQCIAKAETFEQRKARFEAELAGLKEALQVLEGTASGAVLVQVRHHTSKVQLRGLRG